MRIDEYTEVPVTANTKFFGFEANQSILPGTVYDATEVIEQAAAGPLLRKTQAEIDLLTPVLNDNVFNIDRNRIETFDGTYWRGKSKLSLVAFNTTNLTQFVPQVTRQLLIPAGTFFEGDLLTVEYQSYYGDANVTGFYKLAISPSPSVSSTDIITNVLIASGNTIVPSTRRLAVTSTDGQTASATITIDYTGINGSSDFNTIDNTEISSVVVDWTVDNYLFVITRINAGTLEFNDLYLSIKNY